MQAIQKSHILIVDDDANSLLALEIILKDLDKNLILVNSAKEALKYVLAYEFAVILIDAHMPDMDGFEAAHLIRSRTKSANTPIIFMTAFYKDEKDISEGYALGAVDYIFKPINPLILHTKVKVFVDLYQKNKQTSMLEIELKKRLLAEKELKLFTQKTQLILNSAGEGIYGLNAKGIISFANPAAASLLGWTVDEMIGQPIHLMLEDPEISWTMTEFHQALKKNQSFRKDHAYFVTKHGNKIPVEYVVTCIQDSRPSRQGLVVLFKDISERLKSEKLKQQQKHHLQLTKGSRHSTMVEIASSLAHELNQPLTCIANFTKGSIRHLTSKSPNIDEIVAAMKKAAEQAERAGEIIHRIKSFIGKGKLYRIKTNINQIIKSACLLMEYELQNKPIEFRYELTEDLPLINVDTIQIEQVIINLLRNAVEAMNEAKITEPWILLSSSLKNGQMIEISVIDNGAGFPEEVADKILETYFTTKPYGMGLGLSICRTIIEAHGGFILAQSIPQGGACIQFTLPIQ